MDFFEKLFDFNGIIEFFTKTLPLYSVIGLTILSAVVSHFFSRLLVKRKHDLAVFKKQLDKVSDLTQKYYISYIGKTVWFRDFLEKDDADSIFSFYAFALWLYERHLWIKDGKTFLILKNHTSEKLLAHLFDRQSTYTPNILSFQEQHEIVKILEQKEKEKRSVLVDYYTDFFHAVTNKNHALSKMYGLFQINIKSLKSNHHKETKNADSDNRRGKLLQFIKRFVKEKYLNECRDGTILDHFLVELSVYTRLFDSEIFYTNEAWYTKTYYPPSFTAEQHLVIKKELSYLLKKQWVRRPEVNGFLLRIGSPYHVNFFGFTNYNIQNQIKSLLRVMARKFKSWAEKFLINIFNLNSS